MDTLKILHKRSLDNREEIQKSTFVGCYFCKKIILSSDVKNWCLINDVDRRPNCAICPHCSVDSIISDYDCKQNNIELNDELLLSMQKAYFGFVGLKGEALRDWVLKDQAEEFIKELQEADPNSDKTFYKLFNRGQKLLTYTDADVAHTFGTSLPTIARWRSGANAPDPSMRRLVYSWIVNRLEIKL